MKVLYIGAFKDGTGWSRMAIETMRAMISVGIDVTARAIKLNNFHGDLPEEIIEAESKPSYNNYDAVIQNVLPHQMYYNGKIPLNIAYYCTETSHFSNSSWTQYLETMDGGWVPDYDSIQTSHNSGVTIPLWTIPIACEVEKYQRMYKPLSIRERLKDEFLFYYIGDFNRRKNIRTLIHAFHVAFTPDEPVSLVLKTDIAGIDNREAILQEIDKVKHGLKLYPSTSLYKPEIILTGRYSDHEIMRLHESCDCFVCPSHGEAWCLPAFDAMAMGKTPIVGCHTGFMEYMTPYTGWLLPSGLDSIHDMNQTFPDLFTGAEEWHIISVKTLAKNMREAYENKGKRLQKSKAGKQRAYDFSYEKVGSTILSKSLLDYDYVKGCRNYD